MLMSIINSIVEAFDAIYSWLLAFDFATGAISFTLAFGAFAMLYRFLLRPFFYGGVSDTVSKKNKSKKR